MNMPVLGVTIGLLVTLIVVCILPLCADSAEDRGDGRTAVVIPKYTPTSPRRPRTWAFLAITAVLGLIFVEWQRLSAAYTAAVRDVAVAITHNPATVEGYVVRLRPATLLFAVAYIIGIALVMRADPARRLAVAAHAVLYLAMSLLTHSLMIVIGITTGWVVAPFGIEATLANLLIGGLVIMRLTFTSFVLPRATTVPRERRGWLWDSILAWCSLISVVALLIVGYALLSEQAFLTSVWQVFVPLYAVSLLFLLMFAPLWLLWWTNRRLPSPGEERPPVDVIVPAYNEEENIARLLRSIDLATARYGGPVRVVVSNDGSKDRTEQLAREAIARFQHARGMVLTAPNGGQSAALNRGLAMTDAEITVRIDADCVMGPDALVYAVPWFRDPDIGSVGAMEEPRTDNVTWFHRMRALETLFQFRFARVGQSMVDGIVVIPGTFTAFRRGPAAVAGGFPIGMNGEDADLTMQIGRLGYRVVVDPRIRSYEDVPRNPGEFVEQRTRWARAGFHVFARHVPVRAGSAGPRVWFWTWRRGFSWFSLQAGLVAPIFMAELAIAHPSYRQNLATLALLYILGGGVPLIISLPLAVKYRYWGSILWMPTWFAYAFLRRLSTLEAAITLPTRPFPALNPARSGARVSSRIRDGARPARTDVVRPLPDIPAGLIRWAAVQPRLP
jgi:cellulose synthase/poly-beta-1,6-N-acetylglucosamine synthase-like glycosyltransferase